MSAKMSTAVMDAAAVSRPDYQQELVEIIKSNISPKVLRDKVLGYHENDIAAALELLQRDERTRLYNILDAQSLSDILEYAGDMDAYLDELSIKKRIDILSHMEPDMAAGYLRGRSRAERSSLVELMSSEMRKEIALFLSFDEDEIGSIMTTNHIEIPNGISVREAMRRLIEQAAENDNVSTIYVVDEKGIFYGAIDLKDLIIAREGAKLESLITTSYPYVYAEEQIEDCVERIKNYSEDSIPVLDSENRLIGVITAQDFMQVVDDELGEDYAMLAGLSAEEDLNEPVRESNRKRLPWLIILLGLGLLVSGVVGAFEEVVAQLTIIVCFQSLVLDMAGNVGTQSLAVTIRVLMDERLSAKQKWTLVFKETRVGLLNGFLLGLLAFAVAGAYICLVQGRAPSFAFAVSACIGAALLISMALSSLAGTVIPIFFKRIKVDPAVASGPLITTLNDLVAVVSYYGLSWLLLINTLHLAD